MTMEPAFAEIDPAQLGSWERPLDERWPENSERHVNG
jgi:hypothetical protein